LKLVLARVLNYNDEIPVTMVKHVDKNKKKIKWLRKFLQCMKT